MIILFILYQRMRKNLLPGREHWSQAITTTRERERERDCYLIPKEEKKLASRQIALITGYHHYQRERNSAPFLGSLFLSPHLILIFPFHSTQSCLKPTPSLCQTLELGVLAQHEVTSRKTTLSWLPAEYHLRKNGASSQNKLWMVQVALRTPQVLAAWKEGQFSIVYRDE